MTRVFVNGTFDVLHPGHLALLEWAREQGDSLTVGIDSDQRVSELKGSGRPINNQHERAQMLLALRWVDAVFVFDTDQDLRDLISQHDVMVKGSDYLGRPIVGQELGKQILFFERIDEYSSSKKIQHIVDRGQLR